jgi:DNA polymerase elongation subunit (family B)
MHATLFVYQHSIRDEGGSCQVRLFGLKPDGSTAVVRVTDYRPYFYVEVPPSITALTRRKEDVIKYLKSGEYHFPTDVAPVLEQSRIQSMSEDGKTVGIQVRHGLEGGLSYKGMMVQLICGMSGKYEYKRISHYDPEKNLIHVGYPFSKKKYTTVDYYKIHPPFAKKVEFARDEPKCAFVAKKHLYFAHRRRDGDSYLDTKMEYIKVEFRTVENMRSCYDMMNREHIVPIEGVRKRIHLKTHEHEPSITPLLKFFAVAHLPSVGWIDVLVPPVDDSEKETFAEYGIDEYRCSYRALKPSTYEGFCSPKVLTFDIEAYSHIYTAMPNFSDPTNEIFQISVLVTQHKVTENHLLSLGRPNPVPGTKIHTYDTELALLKGFFQMIREQRPNVILGYNSLGFDLKYILRRCTPPPTKRREDPGTSVYNLQKEVYGLNYFTLHTTRCTEHTESWQSSAFGKQDLTILDIDGVVLIDLYPIIKRDFKLTNYKLDTVAEHFLGANKDPVTPKDIFKTYESMDPAKLAWIGKYCVQDAFLTYSLFEKLQIWLGMCEMARTTKVPLMFLFTKGQQVKIYSQLLDYAQTHDYVIESNMVNYEDISYKGATVYAPDPGMYHNVLAFDFASLYPSIIISHNIDYTTLVRDDDMSIPDEHCHVFSWSEHENCEHDPERPEKVRKSDKVYCGDFRYRFLKHEIFGRGIIPTIISDQLEARKRTRKELAVIKQRLEEDLSPEDRSFLALKADVLEERQKSYKVNANSMYGVLGARKGYLPMLPAAMSVTYVGRQSIKKASRYIEQAHGGTILYGDTDSCFCSFPEPDLAKLQALAIQISQETEKLFPKPMKLEYEGKIYKDFFILSKKRYATRACDENGVVSPKIVKKGVQTQRRDSTKLLKLIYDQAIEHIMDGMPYGDMMAYLHDRIQGMFTMEYADKMYTITKSLSKEVYKAKPPQVIIAERMRRRGKQVPVGSRIDYVITTQGGYKAGQCDKIEEDVYFRTYRSAFQLDYLYYVEHQLLNPLEEIVEKAYTKDPAYKAKSIKNMYMDRVRYYQVVQRIRSLFEPVIVLEAPRRVLIEE